MRKRILLFLWGILFLFNGYSQSLKLNVIASDGGVSKIGNMSLEWTLGEFAVETISAGKNLYTQGFHQPILAVKKTNYSPVHESLVDHTNFYRVLLAPNPAKSFVNVFIAAEKNEVHLFTLFDLNGKKVLVKQGNGKDYSVRIEMEQFASGMYLLDIRDKYGVMIKSFKIIKAD